MVNFYLFFWLTSYYKFADHPTLRWLILRIYNTIERACVE